MDNKIYIFLFFLVYLSSFSLTLPYLTQIELSQYEHFLNKKEEEEITLSCKSVPLAQHHSCRYKCRGLIFSDEE